VNSSRTLLFVSPRFLFPVDSGGKIRTTQILRGLKGGRFRIRLLSPGSPEVARRYADEIESVCDEFAFWPEPSTGLWRILARSAYLLNDLPMPVRSDLSHAATQLVRRALADRPAAAVFDFLHAAVLAPSEVECPTVLFTHNVEAEIFARHRSIARDPLRRSIWGQQYRKMVRFEQDSMHRFDVVVAVSERDATAFRRDYGREGVFVIPTGVDLDYFSFTEPHRDLDIVFCGSMDWLANQDGVEFLMEEIWAAIVNRVPEARMTIVGRAPPTALVEMARARGLRWTFTGFVDDVRPYVHGAAVSIIPLRVGGGTRLKVFESMAMGSVVVSTSVGVEGLPVEPGKHCLIADDPLGLADAAVRLIRDADLRFTMARAARDHVVERFGYLVAAREFEKGCELAIEHHRSATARREARRT
jgi:glycosyltransferase involved in cell wall biosynthesis